jgi:hypothetical protein
MQRLVSDRRLVKIPVVEVGPSFGLATLDAASDRIVALLASATGKIPKRVLKAADGVSRRWLVQSANPYLDEIDEIARRLSSPGVYFLTVNYEWGCTVCVAPSTAEGTMPAGAQLVRVLDWITPGLGRNVVAARVSGPAGPFLTLTWPGFTGILQALAPGRFAAAINQAPMRRLGAGIYPFDWAANKARVWRLKHLPPAHLLRRVFEQAGSYAEARLMLTKAPIAAPVIFSLAGVEPGETCIIERLEDDARVHDGVQAAANHWQSHGWHGRPRGEKSLERVAQIMAEPIPFDASWPWLAEPILNWKTRLVMMADARSGRVLVQGFEPDGPATEPLDVLVAA